MMNQTKGVTVEMKKILTYLVLRDKDSQELNVQILISCVSEQENRKPGDKEEV